MKNIIKSIILNGCQKSYRVARRLVIAILGGTVILIGLALIFLPGPAIVVIPIGLAILGLEFAWARGLLRKMGETGRSAFNKGGKKSSWFQERRPKEPDEDSHGTFL